MNLFWIYLSTVAVIQIMQRRTISRSGNNKYETIRKEPAWSSTIYRPGIKLQKLKEAVINPGQTKQTLSRDLNSPRSE